MAAGKGKEYYRSTYTHEELWRMLNAGDKWSVEAAGSVWSSAASGLKAAREEMGTHVISLRAQWTGEAAEEFENRMAIVQKYSEESEEGMKIAADFKIPNLAAALEAAKQEASGLNPDFNEDYDDWLESQGIDRADPTYQSKEPQYQEQYQNYLDTRHDEMARIVGELGEVYAKQADEWKEPPPPPPSDMPGNSTYQPPTGGVFANNGLNSAGSIPGAPGSDMNLAGANSSENGLSDPDDLEPVGSWAPGSYGDIDSDISVGGLAGGGMVVPGGGYTGTVGPSSVGGGGIPGAGLFGPAATGGAGSSPGRGTGGTSPGRSGATKSTGSNVRGSGSGRGSGSNAPGRGGTAGRGGANRGMGSRAGGRTGYYDDDEEEEYTRETWLKEDDINWGDNRTPDEEVDD